MTLLRKVNISSDDSPSIDSFGRWRISNPQTLFDSKNIFNDPGIADSSENLFLFWDNQETSGSGSSTTYSVNKACQSLTVSSNQASTRVRQTFQRFNYQPGKSQLIMMTFNILSEDANVTKRIGYFDDNNGLFLEHDGTDAYFVQRSYTSGTAVNNSVVKSSWNIDSFDGNGPSGITLDFTTTQILYMDFEWLGVGRVRMGFVIDGIIYYGHEFLNSNNLTVVYMSTPNLPLRYEISNNGSGSASSLDTICSTIISEGGQDNTGFIRYAATSTHVDANATGTTYAIVGIRLKSNYIGAQVKLLSASLMEVQGSKNLAWDIRFNASIAGAFTYNDLTNSAVQVAYGATANTVTGGTIIEGGFFASDRQVTGLITSNIDNFLGLGSNIAGTRDTLVLTATPITGDINCDVFGGLNWRENL